MISIRQSVNFVYTEQLYEFLEKKVKEYNQVAFIKDDPISVPHLFSAKPDIEIAGFFAAIFSWGQRPVIISKTKELMHLMDNRPHDFCLNHSDQELKNLLSFKHRTFNTTDLLYFIYFLRHHYQTHPSLEAAFSSGLKMGDAHTGNAINAFHDYFFSLPDFPKRTSKHIASPAKHSCCKRINMFLRWMVRKDKNGVDFGIWNSIKPSQLVIPVDLHVARVARKFDLLRREKTDWLAALELTSSLKAMDAEDPVKYDFALFALGIMEKY